MNTELRESLDRTLLLMRDEVNDQASDEALIAALTGTRVALVADAVNLATPAGQSAFVTAALLMARSAHSVYLVAPDLPLAAPQPPLLGTNLIASLVEVGRDLLPGIQFSTAPPRGPIELCVTLGDTKSDIQARHLISMNATPWAGWLEAPHCATRWREPSWPMGAMIAGALAAGEAFKLAMQKLRTFARQPAFFENLFAANTEARFSLAPDGTLTIANLGFLDFVSGGAITNAALYCLLRLPEVRCSARVIENTTSDLSNLNRYMLQPRSQVRKPKTQTLKCFSSEAFLITSADVRFEASTFAPLLPLAPRVMVGVDHIPTRWFVQESQPELLVIGASTHWSATVTFHTDGLACARCANPEDDDNDGLIPTVAYVSFWAGLLQVGYLLRHLGKMHMGVDEQRIYYTPHRPETPWRTVVSAKANCPLCANYRAA